MGLQIYEVYQIHCESVVMRCVQSCAAGYLSPLLFRPDWFLSSAGRNTGRSAIQGCTHFSIVCANWCVPHNAIAMEKFTPVRCKTAKIHRNEHTPDWCWCWLVLMDKYQWNVIDLHCCNVKSLQWGIISGFPWLNVNSLLYSSLHQITAQQTLLITNDKFLTINTFSWKS